MRPFIALMLLVGCGSGLEQMETSYRGRLTDLDRLTPQIAADKQAEVKAPRAALEAEYAALPQDPVAREPLLGPINQKLHALIQTAEALVQQNAAQFAFEIRQQQLASMQPYIGNWSGPGMTMSITAAGQVKYERGAPGEVHRAVEAPVATWGPTSFEVGFMGINTTFTITKPPYQDGAATKMVIDGVELVRAP